MRQRMAVWVVLLAATGCSRKSAPPCPAGQTLCGGACVRLATDHDDCGACGKVCGASEVCTRGACALSCPAGFVDCGGTCVDPKSNPSYCGASADCKGAHAGTPCATGAACVTGACQCLLQSDIACGGTCLDPQTSTAYCGATADCQGTHAGAACASGEVCVAGACENDDASLSSLTLSAGVLDAAFDPGTLGYTASVPLWIPSIEVTPTAASAGTTLEVDGAPVDSGKASAPLALPTSGAATIGIQITAASGTTETYALTVPRAITYFKASNTNPAGGDHFGASVGASGDTLVVGAPGEASKATGVDGDQADTSDPGAGAAYVFVRDASGTWSQQAYLKASDTAAGDHFGASVGIDGDTVVVGAPDAASSAGAVYVFVRDATGTWSQQARLPATAPAAGDGFGTSVSVSGNTVAVGAPGESGGAGAAHVFLRDGTGTWTKQGDLTAATPTAGDHFGASVSVDGDTLWVGAPDAASSAGAADVFVRDPSGAWTAQATDLVASNTTAGWRFGAAVAVSGDTAVVGSPVIGRGYVFARDATGTWSQTGYLGPGGASAAGFGASVAIRGDRIVVGDPDESGTATGVNGSPTSVPAAKSGAAFVYGPDATGAWTKQAYLKASNPDAKDTLGASVAVGGGTVVAGAPGEASAATGVNGDTTNNLAAGAGAVYAY